MQWPVSTSCSAACSTAALNCRASKACCVKQLWQAGGTFEWTAICGSSRTLYSWSLGTRTRWKVDLRWSSLQYCRASPMLMVMAPVTGSHGCHRPVFMASLAVVPLPAHTSSPTSPAPKHHSTSLQSVYQMPMELYKAGLSIANCSAQYAQNTTLIPTNDKLQHKLSASSHQSAQLYLIAMKQEHDKRCSRF